MPKIKRITAAMRYPRLTLLLFSFAVAFLMLSEEVSLVIYDVASKLGLAGAFVSGVFYSFGLTSAPAAAVLFLLASTGDIVQIGIVAGMGALLSDIAIFTFVRYSLAKEIRMLSKEKIVKGINGTIGRIRNHVVPPIAAFIIASPLPTEIGVALLASVSKISFKKFVLIAYALHTLGIFAILYLGKTM